MKSNKKKYIWPVITLSVTLILLVCVIIVYLNIYNKQKNIATSPSIPTGAIASTVITTTTEPSITDTGETKMTTTLPTYTHVTDFIKDVNLENPEIDDYTISIDNKVITFPCKYATIKELFTLYDGRDVEVPREFDEVVTGTDIPLFAYPENGAGYIVFTFSGNSLEELTCYQVSVSGVSYEENQKVMPVALKGKVDFGTNLQEIIDTFDPDTTRTFDGDGNVQYMTITSGNNTFYYYGKNYQLFQFIFKYGKEGE